MTGNKTKGLISGLTSAGTQIWVSLLLLLRFRYFRAELSAGMMHLHLCSTRHSMALFSPSVCSWLGPDCTSKSLWLAPKHLKSPFQLCTNNLHLGGFKRWIPWAQLQSILLTIRPVRRARHFATYSLKTAHSLVSTQCTQWSLHTVMVSSNSEGFSIREGAITLL